eukprot:COSAG02_NODE_66248_length_256_cov_0.598726_1_plen_47_part_10
MAARRRAGEKSTSIPARGSSADASEGDQEDQDAPWRSSALLRSTAGS